jgi:hypothetical protein
MKQADSDNLAYEKSKMKLYGLLSSITTKEMDERLSVQRSTIESKPTLPAGSATATATASEDTMPPTDTAFVNCPLSLWKDIVHVTTTKTAGNKRIDRDKLTVEFSTIRQRPNESLPTSIIGCRIYQRKQRNARIRKACEHCTDSTISGSVNLINI